MTLPVELLQLRLKKWMSYEFSEGMYDRDDYTRERDFWAQTGDEGARFVIGELPAELTSRQTSDYAAIFEACASSTPIIDRLVDHDHPLTPDVVALLLQVLYGIAWYDKTLKPNDAKRCYQTVEWHVYHPDTTVREAAAYAVASVSPRAKQILEARLEVESDDFVREIIREVLDEITSKSDTVDESIG